MNILGKQATGPRAARFYPMSFWRVAERDYNESSAAIDRFRNAPGDEAELANVFAHKVWRVFVFPSSITFSVPCDFLDDAESVVRTVLSDCPLPVDWA